jgi:AraC-like DNA-binding protein
MTSEPFLEPELHQEWAEYKRLPEIEWLHARFVKHSFAPHTHEGYVFSVIERGVEAFTYRKEIHIATVSSIVTVNPHEVHTGYAPLETGWTYRCIYPSYALIERISRELGHLDSIIFPKAIQFDQFLSDRFLDMHRSFAHNNSSQLERDSLLNEWISHLILRHGENKKSLPKSTETKAIQIAREYLEENYQHNLTLSELANVSQLNEFALLRSFKKIHGLPPHAYLLQTRLRHAKTALEQKTNIAEVAFQHGFADQAHLTRVFKKTFGITPAVYRNA